MVNHELKLETCDCGYIGSRICGIVARKLYLGIPRDF